MLESMLMVAEVAVAIFVPLFALACWSDWKAKRRAKAKQSMDARLLTLQRIHVPWRYRCRTWLGLKLLKWGEKLTPEMVVLDPQTHAELVERAEKSTNSAWRKTLVAIVREHGKYVAGAYRIEIPRFDGDASLCVMQAYYDPEKKCHVLMVKGE
jgi:hypothetical protein